MKFPEGFADKGECDITRTLSDNEDRFDIECRARDLPAKGTTGTRELKVAKDNGGKDTLVLSVTVDHGRGLRHKTASVTLTWKGGGWLGESHPSD